MGRDCGDMINYLAILPVTLLMACSQVLIKLRAQDGGERGASFWRRMLDFASDPVVLLAYGCALVASFAWLYVLSRLPLTIAFPVYVGLNFVLVAWGGWMFLSETLSVQKIIAFALILGGIVLALKADA